MQRWMKALLVVGALMMPALAGHELDNRTGRYNGEYVADVVKVREEGKEDVEFKKVHVVLRNRQIDVVYSPEAKDTARLDNIYTTTYKTEITASSETGKRYFIKFNGVLKNE